jgi:DnaK suppressor protein
MNASLKSITQLDGMLAQRRAVLLAEVREALEQSENQQYIELLDRVPADIGDQSVSDALADLNVAIVDRHVREIRDIESARARIHAGNYGRCVDCGTQIGLERLRAWPTALRCVPCQAQHERTFANPGTPSL